MKPLLKLLLLPIDSILEAVVKHLRPKGWLSPLCCVFSKQLLLVLSFHLLLDVILVVCSRQWNLASRGARQAWGLCAKACHAVTSLSSPARLGQ